MPSLASLIGLLPGTHEALPFIESLVTAEPDIAAREVLRQLRVQGLSVANVTGFRMVAQQKKLLASFAKLGSVGLNDLPNISILESALSPLSRDFSFTIARTGFNRALGERQTHFVTVVSDNLMTPAQLFAQAQTLTSAADRYNALENATFEITRGRISPIASFAPPLADIPTIDMGES